jgi:hypothetical protein
MLSKPRRYEARFSQQNSFSCIMICGVQPVFFEAGVDRASLRSS